tara:strand:- start:1171 stop:1518 length:348 start_codon:yes stop_codon:yes gene_type:complete
MVDEENVVRCPVCEKKETQRLRDDLHKCRTSNRVADEAIKRLNKRVFVLSMIAIGIAAIFGKEALDAVTEWIRSIADFKDAAGGMTHASVIPGPGAISLLAVAGIVSGKTRRRDA